MRRAMLHTVLRASPNTLLFHDWTEAKALWDRIVAIGPVHALVLMPDHIHLLAQQIERHRVGQAMAAWTRWRQRKRQWQGPVWSPVGEIVPIQDRLHLERSQRYLYLNPCRAGLVADPLAWPMSTYLDALGLAVPLLRTAEADPIHFHGYVSGDPSVNPAGTPFPSGLTNRTPTFEEVETAVSAVTRTLVAELRRWSPQRELLIRAARVLVGMSTREIGERLGISHTTVRQIPRESSPEIIAVDRVLCDKRFSALNAVDFRRDSRVRRYLQECAARRLRKSA
jgi:hypothetical protein